MGAHTAALQPAHIDGDDDDDDDGDDGSYIVRAEWSSIPESNKD